MTTLASGSHYILAYVKEVTRGTTPAGPGKVFRCTSRVLNLTKTILESAEVRTTGQVSDSRHGFNKVEGSPGFQLSLADFDDLFELAMRASWAAVSLGTDGSINVTADTADNSFTRASGSFITEGVRPGDFVTGSAFADGPNNVRHRVLQVVSATKIIVDTNLTTHAAEAGVLTFTGKRIDMGNTLTTWSVESQQSDITRFRLFKGVAVNSLSFTVSPGAMVTGALSLLGMSAAPLAGSTGISGGAPTAASTNAPFAAFDGSLYENGAIIAVVTSLDFAMALNRSTEGVVGSHFTPDIFDGTAKVTGNMTALMDDTSLGSTLVDKFQAETESSLWLELRSADSAQWLSFVFHRIKFNGNDIQPPQSGAVPQKTPWQALEHATYATTMSIQRSNS